MLFLSQFRSIGNVTLNGNDTLRNKIIVNPSYLRQTLVDVATIQWDANQGSNAVVTLTASRTIAAPTNLRSSATYVLEVVQDATGGRTLNWNTIFKFPGGVLPVLSTAPNAIDLFTFYFNGSVLMGSYIRGVA